MAQQPIEGQDLGTECWSHCTSRQTEVECHPAGFGMTSGKHVEYFSCYWLSDSDYGYRSVATQIPHDVELA